MQSTAAEVRHRYTLRSSLEENRDGILTGLRGNAQACLPFWFITTKGTIEPLGWKHFNFGAFLRNGDTAGAARLIQRSCIFLLAASEQLFSARSFMKMRGMQCSIASSKKSSKVHLAYLVDAKGKMAPEPNTSSLDLEDQSYINRSYQERVVLTASPQIPGGS